MTLREKIEKTGSRFFRWRSYLPLIAGSFVLVGMKQYHYPLNSHYWDHAWEAVCLTISFCGLAVRIYTVGNAPPRTSGRNTKRQLADVLNTTGLYSILRHPLYLGNFFIWLGISMFIHLWWVSLMFVLMFLIIYQPIIMAEEKFLKEKFGNEYESWAHMTPAFYPRFKNWKNPKSPFSLKRVLKKEYSGFFAIIASFTCLEIIGDLIVEGKLKLDLMWIILFSIGLITYLTLRTLKKKSRILRSQKEE
ncbi:MAG: isoprenylcysteine carboxylmethyltransferase family protein [Desulfobacterales bacterium]|jgi:protein-S-isoprenylcysteine O-methyltransferase Ste14